MRFRRRQEGPPPIWRGVYRSFDEIPPSGAPYASVAAVDAAERLLRETEQDPMPREAEVDHQVLALAVRLLHATNVAVIDHAGGLGQSYAALRRMIPPAVRLRYRVVELDPVVARGRAIWSGNEEVEMTTELDLETDAPSIVFSKGFIQYIADYRALLRNYFTAGARFVLLEKLPVVTSMTYATVQVGVYGADVPYWMFHIADLAEVAQAAGYRIALQRRLERVYDQSAFPAELRMERATSLLFERA